ncbi:MAG TPA: Calx-beta domain-containing protein [Pyrinomonadaceae bacterium]|nr:Calx-beta domain-containing protein [Pyrinomonadaceae bacterium]
MNYGTRTQPKLAALLRAALFQTLLATAVVLVLALSASATTFFHVTTVADNGDNVNPTPGSLRAAIIAANKTPGADVIDFNITGSGVHTIKPPVPLPQITDPVSINAYTQPGASVNQLSEGDNAVLLIEIDGSLAVANGNLGDGLWISAGDSDVNGLIIKNFSGNLNNQSVAGLRLTKNGKNSIEGNFIGTNSNGTVAAPNGMGIIVDGSPDNQIGGVGLSSRNLISGNSEFGVYILNAGATGNSIQGNFIGADKSGKAALGNLVGVNINDLGTAFSNLRIGGTSKNAGNTISANTVAGIDLQGKLNGALVQGNVVGLDVTGIAPLGNGSGIQVANISDNAVTIGGSAAGARNIISGNKHDGIEVVSPQFKGTVIEGNYIGTDITGNMPQGNGEAGIKSQQDSVFIGGNGPGAGNVISGNGGSGLHIGPQATHNSIWGNFIGCAADHVSALPNGQYGIWIESGSSNTIGGEQTSFGNTIVYNDDGGVYVTNGAGNWIAGNSISGNGGLGIDLGANGVTPNDQLDGDTGPNLLQNYPVITSAVVGANTITVSGNLNSTPNSKFRVYIYSNNACSSAGFGQGENFVGAFDVTTDANGNAGFSQNYQGLVLGQMITATAADTADNTSEFSQCVPVTSPQAGSLQFSAPAYSINENGAQATITVTRSVGQSGAVTVDYATADGTAKAGSDYTSVKGTLIWANGDTSPKTFGVPIADDSINEPNETINLSLSNPLGGASLGNQATALLTIADNDPVPSISISNANLAEGNNGTTDFTFLVKLSAVSGQTVTVNYATADGTAQAGSDYQAASGLVSFAPGEASKAVTILVNGDINVEPDETFFVNLSNPVNGALSQSKGVGTIINDDQVTTPTLQFSQAAYNVPEALVSLVIKVTRSGDASTEASVDYATADGTATQKGDFEYAAGTLVFAPGETSKTFQVLINDDMYLEGDETFNLVLSNPAGAVIGQQQSAVVTIKDNTPESITNPIDDAQSFVNQNYHDFLNREPDAAGLAFWTNQITACGSDSPCVESARNNVSAAFFLSIEFQQTGYLLYLMQKESFAISPKYASFMRDVQELSRGVIVNTPGWQSQLVSNQQAFASKWVNRTEFKAVFDNLSNDAFVNAVYANAGIVPPQTQKDKLIAQLNAAAMTRSGVLLSIANDATYRQQEQNRAFVLMEYFGYLRRDPSAAPDSDMSGYNFWLNKLNQFDGNYQDAEMVKAFTNSTEYRQRFGP